MIYIVAKDTWIFSNFSLKRDQKYTVLLIITILWANSRDD